MTHVREVMLTPTHLAIVMDYESGGSCWNKSDISDVFLRLLTLPPSWMPQAAPWPTM